MLISRGSAGLLLLLFCCTATAQVYQWKDKSGRTILSDTPPPASVKSRVLDTGDTATSGTNNSNTSNSLADRDQAFRQRQQKASAKADQDAKEKAALQERQRYCEDARRQLALLKSGERIVQRDLNGERSYLDDEQRNLKAESTQRYLDSNCKDL